MKTFILILIFIVFSISCKADVLNKFPFTCLCDNQNTFMYFDCKNKIGGAILELKNNNKDIYNSTDEKYYTIHQNLNLLTAYYDAETYQSSITLDDNLFMIFQIFYPEFDKEWSYKLRCTSVK